MDNNLKAQLVRFAESDLRLARKQGDVIITNTKKGNLTVQYNRDSRSYDVYRNTSVLRGYDSQVFLTNAKKSKVVDFLVDSYQVEG